MLDKHYIWNADTKLCLCNLNGPGSNPRPSDIQQDALPTVPPGCQKFGRCNRADGLTHGISTVESVKGLYQSVTPACLFWYPMCELKCMSEQLDSWQILTSQVPLTSLS